MIESPLLKELLAEKEQEDGQEFILAALAAKFTTVPEELAREVRAASNLGRLKELHRLSVTCKSLKEFQKRLAEGDGER